MLPCFLECQPFGLILDALQDGVTIYDRNGDLIWINDKACRILGVPRTELVGRNVSEIASSPTVQTIITQEFASRSSDECRSHSTRIEDYASPGYMVFANGKKLLYMGTYVRDEDDAVQYAIYTIRAATDLDEARRKIEELQKLTTLYQDQLRTLHLQVLGQEIVACSESMQKVLTHGGNRGREEPARPLPSRHESAGAGAVHPCQLREPTRVTD
jgi:PAS domain S-box-containing protein